MIAVMAPVLPHVVSGKLRGVAVTGVTRSSTTPDIPTIAESGVPDYEFNTWYGIQVPAGTPRVVVRQLNADVLRALQAADACPSRWRCHLKTMPICLSLILVGTASAAARRAQRCWAHC